MKIGMKLIIGFVGVALIGALIGVVGIVSMRSLDEANNKMYEKMAVPLGHLAKMIESFQRERINVRDLVDSETLEATLAAEKTTLELRAALNENAALFEKTILTDAGRKAFDDFLTDDKAYQAVVDQVIVLAKAGKHEEAKSLVTGEGKKIAQQERGTMNQLLELKINVTRQTAEENNALTASSSLLMIIVIIIGVLASIALGFVLSMSITRPLGEAVRLAAAISTGDLKQEVPQIYLRRVDEIGALAKALKEMIEQLRTIALSMIQAADTVSSGSGGISASAQQLSQGSAEQASSVEEVSASVEEMASSIRQNAENASTTEKIAQTSATEAIEGGRAVDETVNAMKNIAGKIGIIEEIARQTNLLALNAAIEAARAGDAGKGFAVVASEVRKLAERSQLAAQEISTLSVTSVAVAEKAGGLLKSIVPAIQKTSELVQEITSTSKEQSTGSDQIAKAVMQLDQVVQQNASAAEEMASMAEELSSQAQQMQATMEFFKVDSEFKHDKASAVHVTQVAHIASSSQSAARKPLMIEGKAPKAAGTAAGAKPAPAARPASGAKDNGASKGIKLNLAAEDDKFEEF